MTEESPFIALHKSTCINLLTTDQDTAYNVVMAIMNYYYGSGGLPEGLTAREKLILDNAMERIEAERTKYFNKKNASVKATEARLAKNEETKRERNENETRTKRSQSKSKSKSKSKSSKEDINVMSGKPDNVTAIEYLNEKAGTHYRTIDSNKYKIDVILRKGYTLDDIKTVIDFKCSEWLGTEMAKFLRPDTLFGPKFDGYLNQGNLVNSTKQNDTGSFTTDEFFQAALKRARNL